MSQNPYHAPSPDSDRSRMLLGCTTAGLVLFGVIALALVALGFFAFQAVEVAPPPLTPISEREVAPPELPIDPADNRPPAPPPPIPEQTDG